MLPMLFACASDPVDSSPGDTAAPDTQADEADELTLDDLQDHLPRCVPGVSDARLDVETGCADGACIGMTYDELVGVLGEEPGCYSYSFDIGGTVFGYVSCDRTSGIGASFADDDLDGEPDGAADSLSVDLPCDGGSAVGLSLGIQMSCFVGALGDPDGVEFGLDASGNYVITGLSYFSAAQPLTVDDSYDNVTDDYIGDGLVDGINFY